MGILVLGARGMLGTDLLNEWRSDELIPAGSADADLRDFSQVERLIQKVRPDWIINSAAYTDVDGCEKNPDLAFAVNATGVENVARAAESIGARVFLVSTMWWLFRWLSRLLLRWLLSIGLQWRRR